ncbi:hypothetical protein RHGRI_034293 [Rhododendron griersonianum]|uniref:Poly A polymerase head domain-containing protein n=1 Tax=Rhododendron griersonianum TaxID=479676 RepID=A0AAV6I385_9ERIC|nr:hypothetical protein RHGRI_034293 [Rhododendron griersonianum]
MKVQKSGGEKNIFMDFDFELINQFVSTNLSIFLHGSKKSSPWSLRWDGVGMVLRHSALNGLPCRGLRERIDFCSLSISHYPKSIVLRCLHLFSSLLCVWCGLLFYFRQGSQAVQLRSVCLKRFGTPEEDAYRRDLTINSLFYNINTSVEDFTARDIADLISGRIVTPLPPKETFLDDPLRVLRAIRFVGICMQRSVIIWVVFSLPPEIDPLTFQGCESSDSPGLHEPFRFGIHLDLRCLYGCRLEPYSAYWILYLQFGKLERWVLDEQRRLGLYATLFLPLRSIAYKVNKSKEVLLLS